jgi:peroxiredoxin
MGIKEQQTAPDFTLNGLNGEAITLSDFKHKKNILLLFNRGFG